MRCVSWAVKQVCLLLFGTVWGWWLCSHSPEMPSCFWHPEAQQVAVSPLHPRFLLLSLRPLHQHVFDNVLNARNTQNFSFVVEIYRCENITELEQEADKVWLVISMDWMSSYRLYISRNNMVVWHVHVFYQGCDLRLTPAMPWLASGMECWPPASLCGGCAGAEGQSPARED